MCVSVGKTAVDVSNDDKCKYYSVTYYRLLTTHYRTFSRNFFICIFLLCPCLPSICIYEALNRCEKTTLSTHAMCICECFFRLFRRKISFINFMRAAGIKRILSAKLEIVIEIMICVFLFFSPVSDLSLIHI